MELFEALRDHFSENNEWQETGLRFLPEWNDFVKPPVLIASGVIYVIVFVSLYYAMRNFEPMVLRTPMRVYNLAQVGLCLYMSYGILATYPPLCLIVPESLYFDLSVLITLPFHVSFFQVWLTLSCVQASCSSCWPHQRLSHCLA